MHKFDRIGYDNKKKRSEKENGSIMVRADFSRLFYINAIRSAKIWSLNVNVPAMRSSGGTI